MQSVGWGYYVLSWGGGTSDVSIRCRDVVAKASAREIWF